MQAGPHSTVGSAPSHVAVHASPPQSSVASSQTDEKSGSHDIVHVPASLHDTSRSEHADEPMQITSQA
jgi:hypothetical protein